MGRTKVSPSRFQSSAATGRLHSNECPKSPWKTMLEIHFQYWT